MRSLPTAIWAVAVAVSLAVAAAADSPPSGPDGIEGTALDDGPPGLHMGKEVPTGSLLDIAGLLRNLDGKPLRVRSVRLLSPSASIGAVRFAALAPSQDAGGSFVIWGDPARCLEVLGGRLLPVSRIVEPPHGESDWRLVVSVKFHKPGRYQLYVLKVAYSEGGNHYWGYVRADIAVRAVSPGTDPSLAQPAC